MDRRAEPTYVYASDFLTFALVILVARKLRVPGLKFPSILDTIREDATLYFLVIFTSHFVLMITVNLGRVSWTVLLPTRTTTDDIHL